MNPLKAKAGRSRRQHILTVDQPVVKFAALIAAVRQAGERVGWLEWQPQVRRPRGPESLESAAELGVLRAVAIGDDGSASIKPMIGPANFDDVLREHFRGCQLVLVHGQIEAAPHLKVDLADSARPWRIESVSATACRTWSTESLVSALRRVRPFDAPEPAA